MRLIAVSSNDNLIITVAGAILVMMLSPIVVLWVTNHARQKDREAEWKHQEDEAKAAVIAEALANGIEIDSNGTAAEIRASLNKELLDRVNAAKDAIDVVHTFVNADKLASVQRELDSTKRELVMLRTIHKLSERLGDVPDDEALGIIAATEARIVELQVEIAQRQVGADQAAEQIRKRPGGAVGG